MKEMRIAVRKQPAEYEPGEEIAGGAQWVLDHAPHGVEARLLWHVKGQQKEDVGVVDKVQFETPMQEDTRSFTFKAPEAPYSFAGKLVTLEWVVELVALPSNESAHVSLVIAPEGKVIQFEA